MSAWIKVVPVEETSPDKCYFIGRPSGHDHFLHYQFWSQYLNGKEAWSVKAGIAIQYRGGDSLVAAFAKNSHVKLVAIEVPPDADKRWRARRPRGLRK